MEELDRRKIIYTGNLREKLYEKLGIKVLLEFLTKVHNFYTLRGGLNPMALDALKEIARKIIGSTSIDKKFVEEMVRDIQRALIKADVNVKQVKEISEAIKKRALSEEVLEYFDAREHVLKIVYEELLKGVGEGIEIPLKKSKIMLVGLQGSGKTTTAVKIAKYFKDRGLKTAVVAADTWRPAAFEQLKQLAEANSIAFYGYKG
ncbi:MAG: signal recognition particle receptor subunit alpha, partial [Archaeoglobaceae archaeon]